MQLNQIHLGNAFELATQLEDNSLDCIITSPPYWGLRDYGTEGQLGNEHHYNNFIDNLFDLFDVRLKSKLKDTGTLWVNIGDTYNNYKCQNRNPIHSDNLSREALSSTGSHFVKKNITNIPKRSLLNIPARFAIAMTDRGWILRNAIVWAKPNPMPESIKNRCTRSYEMLYFFTKTNKYYSGFEKIKTKSKKAVDNRSTNRKRIPTKIQGGVRKSGVYEYANKRDVWSVPVARSQHEHTAIYPEKLIEPCVIAGCPPEGLILDPFMGTGTTAIVARKHSRKYIGFELNEKYIEIATQRLAQQNLFQSN